MIAKFYRHFENSWKQTYPRSFLSAHTVFSSRQSPLLSIFITNVLIISILRLQGDGGGKSRVVGIHLGKELVV